jgi:hypothetical protein
MISLYARLTGTAVATSLVLAGVVVPTAAVRADDGRYERHDNNGQGNAWGRHRNRDHNEDRDDDRRNNGYPQSYPNQYPNQYPGDYPDRDDDYGRPHKKDNTGTIIGGLAIGAGLLWILSQAGKNKNKTHRPTETTNGPRGGDWTNPDNDERSSNDPLGNLSARERRAVDVCDTAVENDVRAKGGSTVALDRLGGVSGNSRMTVTGDWSARFPSKGQVVRAVTCTVENDRVTDYRLS